MLAKSFFQAPITHRTLHDVTDGRPENSVAGARAAIERGYGIEIDLQLSKDGVPMVFHDYSLERLTHANGVVAQCDAAELSNVALKGGDEGIPTLEAFLKVVDGQVPLLVEIKDQDGALGPKVGKLAKATCALMNDYKGDKALMSFNPHTVAKCAKWSPEIARGIVTDPYLKEHWPLIPDARRIELAEIPDYERVGACFISHNVNHLTDAPVARIKAMGADVLCWTVKSAEQEKIARQVAQNVTFERYLA